MTKKINAPPSRTDAARISDRVLLYARGLDLDPVFTLELALESMRNTGLGQADRLPQPGLAEVMAEFQVLLARHDLSLRLSGESGEPLASMPPMCRRKMVPEEMDRFPFKKMLHRLITAMRGKPGGQNFLGKR